ncbi:MULTISPECIES: STAS domain-containing protein [unclassified Mesobacillus]|uniref:STAS domain-containing protein n=1 Tax=unclassified Mesobacillus TaxID=2675270 RepID=UPI00203C4D04|nr:MULTISPECIES: STAS domain-containing protein [unclassified Mesobacillus]MCM3122945.1 STAS domain-containing protein [Mesobacillus sp. MER 33]MCM3233572.1 STAS domain-containing protein [Mesobacillus sp. MER 48]
MGNPNYQLKVNKNEFVWNSLGGELTFDGAPALLFWDSAIELFLKTIEEISGNDVSKTVYEVTGYRMGHLVSSYYEGRTDVVELLNEYSDIYKSAGWGVFEIHDYSYEEKRAVVRIRNSWEHRIFKLADKNKVGVLLPSHWAGIFSGLFQQDMWYKMTKSQLHGHEYDEVEIFPSDITISQNIHLLARKKDQESIIDLENKVKERTEELSSLVQELSSPIIPVLKDILVIPLIGKYNEERVSNMLEKSLTEVTRLKAKYLLIDLTGIKQVDSYSIHGIQKLIRAIRLIGAKCFIVGISSELSIQILRSNINLDGIQSFSSLQQGVEYAIQQNGYELVKKK